MRLAILDQGHTLGQRVLLKAIRVMTGFAAPDVVKTLFYRKEFFGHHHSALTQLAMRGPSEWSVGERELFATFVSRLNQCVF
jgi:hypothetical protein